MASDLLKESYWKNVLYACKLTRPLVEVLRMINGDEKPPMGYIYEALDRAKETIASSFGHKEEYYEMPFKYIDRRVVPDLETQDKIIVELNSYKSSQGLFGIDMAIRERMTLAPGSNS